MNEYKEALKRIKSVQAWDESLGAFWNIFDHRDDDIKLIEELIAEKTEQLSRKDKLVVGSEWECVVNTYAPVRAFYIDPVLDMNYSKIGKSAVVKVIDFDDMRVLIVLNTTKCILSKDQFLLCFKPREKPNE